MKIIRNLRHLFQRMLGWDLVLKSQLILIYASLMKLGLYFLLYFNQNHPLVDHQILMNLSYILLFMVAVNMLLWFGGYAIKKAKKQQLYEPYAIIVISYYVISMLISPVVLGFLNIVNGLIVTLIIMICMTFFPKNITRIVIGLFAIGYTGIVFFTFLGYLDYGLLFQHQALIHPLLQNTYLLGSLTYASLLMILILYLFRLCIDAWHEKMYFSQDLTNYKDQVTGVLNAYGLQQIVSLKLREASFMEAELSLVILDIDNFKRILANQDEKLEAIVLKHVADVLCNHLRQSDIVARYGVEQFVLILAFTSIDRAEEVAEMCRKNLEQAVLQLENGESIRIKASLGVTSTCNDDFEFDEMLASAQKALYLAKENGKNQVYSIEAQ